MTAGGARMIRLAKMGELTFLPVSIRTGGILVIGGGRVATHKVRLLMRHTSDIRVIGAAISDELKESGLPYEEREVEARDLDMAKLLFICTGDHDLNRRLKDEAARRRIPASVCDSPELCDFTSPAICDVTDGVTIAVASDAKDVMRSIRIRDRIKQLIADGTLQID